MSREIPEIPVRRRRRLPKGLRWLLRFEDGRPVLWISRGLSDAEEQEAAKEAVRLARKRPGHAIVPAGAVVGVRWLWRLASRAPMPVAAAVVATGIGGLTIVTGIIGGPRMAEPVGHAPAATSSSPTPPVTPPLRGDRPPSTSPTHTPHAASPVTVPTSLPTPRRLPRLRKVLPLPGATGSPSAPSYGLPGCGLLPRLPIGCP